MRNAICLGAGLSLAVVCIGTGCGNDDDSRPSGAGTAGAPVGGGSGSGGSSGDTGGAGGSQTGGASGSNTGGTGSSGDTGGASGSAASSGEGGSPGTGGAGGAGGSAGTCFDATLLWFEDFETGDYSRWTSSDYGNDWNDGYCHANGFSTDQSVSPTHSHRSEITCTSTESHRGYGGLQFDGDQVLGAYTNAGTGTEAPFGVVNTYWSWLEAPYDFADGRWFSFWTVNSDCGWAEDVITLGLENTSYVLTPAHIANTGGTVTFAADPPAFPKGEWVRTTIYINYYAGEMQVWQNGQEVVYGEFSRPTNDICQWHWGAYANQDNYDVALYEDDLSIYKLNEPWTDFSVEPYFGVTVPVCG